MWVLPVPLLPSAMTFSRQPRDRQRRFSIISGCESKRIKTSEQSRSVHSPRYHLMTRIVLICRTSLMVGFLSESRRNKLPVEGCWLAEE